MCPAYRQCREPKQPVLPAFRAASMIMASSRQIRPISGHDHGTAAGLGSTCMAVMLALLAWFGAELIMAGGRAGLAERVLGGVQATWPLAAVLSCYLPVRAPAAAPKVNQASRA
jgi:hypothetical protein